MLPLGFQSPRPTRDATCRGAAVLQTGSGFNPRVPRGTRLRIKAPGELPSSVSIPASHAGRDKLTVYPESTLTCFNPRVPRGTRHLFPYRIRVETRFNPRVPRGTRLPSLATGSNIILFQSPRPTRDATADVHRLLFLSVGFNPRVPRGTRPDVVNHVAGFLLFQSPRPTRDATFSAFSAAFACASFNPRVPRGTRLKYSVCGFCPLSFQSPRPTRDATNDLINVLIPYPVSIPASHAGRDAGQPVAATLCYQFQSPRPTRDATEIHVSDTVEPSSFNPRVPRGTRLRQSMTHYNHAVVSIPASHAGRDLDDRSIATVSEKFQSPRPTRDATRARTAN